MPHPAPPRHVANESGEPIWASEPFRVFFPLGLVAATFGLLLWPMHYLGWWPIFPAIQHPRLLVFGFGAAFVFGFLGTAWPRFLEAGALRRFEVVVLAAIWLAAQFYYARAAIRSGDILSAIAFAWLLFALGRRFLGAGRSLPPAGFATAFLSLFVAFGVSVSWAMGWSNASPELDHLHRLLAYQGFLLLPLLGVGSYLFPRFAGARPGSTGVSGRRRTPVVWGTAGLLLVSFAIEAYLSVRWGNACRLAIVAAWIVGAVPGVFRGSASSTRHWALRVGIGLILLAFLCRAIWPREVFAFEHILFLGGFSQLMLLVGDRVLLGHSGDLEATPSRSPVWRWIVWLILLTAATRAVADLVPSTRISHHIYAAIMLVVAFVIWGIRHAKRFREVPPPTEH